MDTMYSLTSNPRTDLDSCTNDLKPYGLKLKTYMTKCHNFWAYRHPRSAIDNHTFHFKNAHSKRSSIKLVSITGDFNINLLDYASHTPF